MAPRSPRDWISPRTPKPLPRNLSGKSNATVADSAVSIFAMQHPSDVAIGLLAGATLSYLIIGGLRRPLTRALNSIPRRLLRLVAGAPATMNNSRIKLPGQA